MSYHGCICDGTDSAWGLALTGGNDSLQGENQSKEMTENSMRVQIASTFLSEVGYWDQRRNAPKMSLDAASNIIFNIHLSTLSLPSHSVSFITPLIFFLSSFW